MTTRVSGSSARISRHASMPGAVGQPHVHDDDVRLGSGAPPRSTRRQCPPRRRPGTRAGGRGARRGPGGRPRGRRRRAGAGSLDGGRGLRCRHHQFGSLSGTRPTGMRTMIGAAARARSRRRVAAQRRSRDRACWPARGAARGAVAGSKPGPSSRDLERSCRRRPTRDARRRRSRRRGGRCWTAPRARSAAARRGRAPAARCARRRRSSSTSTGVFCRTWSVSGDEQADEIRPVDQLGPETDDELAQIRDRAVERVDRADRRGPTPRPAPRPSARAHPRATARLAYSSG